ncbi:MAG: BamA/TamA family outer membrane protein [Bacteroidia bacterium]|nr:BamA/TamA family outer membrane protein [Bacteroidia bacterium]
MFRSHRHITFLLRYVFLPLAIFCRASALEAQTRVDVAFEGLSRLNDRDLERELRSAGVLRPDSVASLAATRIIEARALQQGLYFASVIRSEYIWSTDSSDVTIRIAVDEGPALVVCELLFSGGTAVSGAELAEACDSKENALFSEAVFAADMERILDLYEQRGYPFASLHLAAFDVTERDDLACAHIRVTIEEGELFVISEITVEGNALTKTQVILRETRLETGSIFDPEKLSDARRSLERLRFFSSVADPQLYVRDGRGGVLLRVAEGSTNLFDGVIGYQPPRRDGEEGYLTGLVNVSFRNIFGTGRRMDARWERTTQSISELEIRYLEPWLLGLPLNIQAGLFQRQQDSSYVRRSVDASVTLLAGRDVQLTARGIRTDVIPSEFSTIMGLTSSTTWSGGAQLLIDTRDDVYNPRSGIQLRNSWNGGTKTRTITATSERTTHFVQRIELDAAAYRELLPRVVAAVSLHGRELRGGALDLSDLYRLGGAASLRGYREEQFTGTRLGWINAEMRYSLGRRSFAFSFYDIGYMFQSADPEQGREETSLSRGGYGLGLRLETGLGIMSVSYALGYGDALGDGKIHFGLINEF